MKPVGGDGRLRAKAPALGFPQTLWQAPIARIERENALLSSNWFEAGGSTLLSMEREIGSIHEALAKRRGVKRFEAVPEWQS